MSWLKETTGNMRRVLHAKFSNGIHCVSDSFIVNIERLGKLDITDSFSEKQIIKLVRKVLESESKEEDNYIKFAISKKNLENIIIADSEFVVFGVNKNHISTTSDSLGEVQIEDVIIIRYDGQERMSLIPPCLVDNMDTWTPDLQGSIDEAN